MASGTFAYRLNDSPSAGKWLETLSAGGRESAIERIECSLRQSPKNGGSSHLLALSCLWEARIRERSSHPETAAPFWEKAIAGMGAVLADDAYWQMWKTQAIARYQVAVEEKDFETARKEIEHRLLGFLPTPQSTDPADIIQEHPTWEILFRREQNAAGLLRTCGGLRVDESADTLACGPLFLRLIERGESLARLLHVLERRSDSSAQFQNALAAHRLDAPANRFAQDAELRRLRAYFSSLGVAQAWLDAGHPDCTLSALRAVACPRCQAAKPANAAAPTTCIADCCDFDRLNPSYGALEEKASRLANDARELTVDAHLALAEHALKGSDEEMAAGIEHLRNFLGAVTGSSTAAHRQSQLVDLVLGRVDGLGRARLESAVKLLESVLAIFVNAELTARLAERIATRGVEAAKEKPAKWLEAVADLRRSLELHELAHDTRLNLCIALHNWSLTQREAGEEGAALTLVRESIDHAREGLRLAPHQTSFERFLRDVRPEWLNRVRPTACALAAKGDFAAAKKLLEGALKEAPGDPHLESDLRQVQSVLEIRG